MKSTLQSKFALLAGASALAFTATPAVAQEDDDQRTLTTIVVTTQKTEESIQDVPIAVSAFDEAALDKLQLAGGPDLVKSIPNVSFSKGNFAGYNFKIRGIGNDAVAQSGDSGVGVHQNDVPLTANRLFEAEFFDVERVETLRGPQGTLYGRNATGGVVNVITAKPVLEEWQGNVKGTLGNFDTRKIRGMLNVPLGDSLAFRVAGSYLERGGFATNTVTDNDIDGRELYGIRGTLAFEPTESFRSWLMVEHFSEDDSRIRSGKQLCSKDEFDTEFMGIPIGPANQLATSLGCQEAPLSQSLDRVNSAATLGGGLAITAGLLNGDAFTAPLNPNLREIESAFDPIYQAESTLYTLKGEYDLNDSLTLSYIGSYMEDKVLSREDYNKIAPTIAFNETAGAFAAVPALYGLLFPGGVVADPQLGTSNVFRTFDQSGGESEQITHELRLQSSYDGRFNFNLGAIYVDFEAIDPANGDDGYYVFSNSLTALAQINNAAGGAFFGGEVPIDTAGNGEALFEGALGGDGGNYFRSLSPYRLESFAVFGEGYFDVTDDIQFTLGLRYTDDQKEQDVVPSILFTPGGTIDPSGVLEADFQEVTGRAGFDWSPDLNFSEDTLLYAFYSRGYKGGGINPPQPAGAELFPQTFEPEFINSYEIGTKNTLAGGALQLNASGFFYDYEGYQITQIINRSSVNFNIDAELTGFELETLWNPVSTLVLSANLGLLDTKIIDTFGIDVLDRGNSRADLAVLKNATNFANCVISAQGYASVLGGLPDGSARGLCDGQTAAGVAESIVDPMGTTPGVGTGDAAQDLALLEGALGLTGVTVAYTNPDGTMGTASALQPFEGDAKNLDGNSIPGAPETTFSFGAEYTWLPSGEGQLGDWSATARADYYMQADSFSRVWNTGRDELESWDNVNLSLRLDNDMNNVSIEIFGKNVTDEEVITGAYLTDDSSGLFTNIFLTEPNTWGVSVSKSW